HQAEPALVRRLRDLPKAELLALAGAAGLGEMPTPSRRAPAVPAGLVQETNGTRAVLFGAPFGRCTAAQLGSLAAIAETADAADLRLSPWRGLA
ncbi:hypothetical protein ABTD96_19320, partial [Acinetobacter baumannii]